MANIVVLHGLYMHGVVMKPLAARLRKKVIPYKSLLIILYASMKPYFLSVFIIVYRSLKRMSLLVIV